MRIICEDEGTSFEVEEGDYIENLNPYNRKKAQTFLVQKDGIWSTKDDFKKGTGPFLTFVRGELRFGSTVMVKRPCEKPVLITDII